MDTREVSPRMRILSVSGTDRRRWADGETVRIGQESDSATLAGQYEISQSMLSDWRYLLKLGLFGCSSPFVHLVRKWRAA